jgi:aspartyl-tRNA(Asn)/glutamyl-tRNA(Gln) amidotransferase subunit B
MRSKEEAHDYRYFPEPDLPPLVLAAERIEEIRASLPELPWERRARFVTRYDLSPADARVLTQTHDLGDYYEAAVAAMSGDAVSPKGIANWVMTEVLRELKERRVEVDAALPPGRLAALVALVDAGRISNSAAKEVFAAVWESGEEPAAAVERLGLAQVSDASQIERWIDEVLEQNAGPVAQYRAGKAQTMGFLVGQVMKRSGGRAQPTAVQELLRQALEREPVPGG